MSSDEEARKAIAETNGKSIDGRQLNVNIAKERSR
jgi:RNA recognition motif-containing protein